jgi:hypothetical protein
MLQIAGIIIIIVMGVMIGLGAYNIVKGIKMLPQAEILGQEPVWHKQPNILLGISNVIFGIMIALVGLVILATGTTARIIIFILIAITFLLSMAIVIRTVTSTMNAVRNLSQRQKNKNLE